MKQIGHLKVDGKVYRHKFSRAEERVKEYLASLPDDELMHIIPLARNGGFSTSTISLTKDHLFEMGLAYRHGARVYYGNKKAIAALRLILAS